jgi:hypothetical protein
MMTHPNLNKVWRGQRGMRSGIKACVRAKCVVSALTLIYSAVDALAALARETVSTRGSRREFTEWVNLYLLPELAMDLSALDLYGARCGIVHTYSPASDLARDGRARLLVYKWREGHRPDDPVLEERSRTAAVVEIEALAEALERAVAAFEQAVLNNAALRVCVERNVKDLLCYEPWHPVEIIVAA